MKTLIQVSTNPLPLVPNIPGSKKRHLKHWQRILEAEPYQAVYEPFAGGLATSLALEQARVPTVKTVSCGEIDPTLVGLYLAWSNESLQDLVIESMDTFQQYPLEDIANDLKEIYKAAWNVRVAGPHAVAAGLLLRYLGYSGKLTPSAKNPHQLNISFSAQKAKRWGRIKYTFPPYNAQLSVNLGWDGVEYGELLPSLSIIDPPYVGEIGDFKRRDERYLGPSYIHHKPNHRDTYLMALWATEKALVNEVSVVIACNYYAPRFDLDYRELADLYGYECYSQRAPVNMRLNNGVNGDDRNTYSDHFWVFCYPGSPVSSVMKTADAAQLTDPNYLTLF